MARPRLLVSSSERLARLDALLVASGAARGDVAWLDDALELFSIDAADGAILVADLEATPIADAGLLRRWLDGEPGARVLWIGDDPSAVDAFAAAGAPGEAWPWPLDLDQLARLARGTFDVADAPPPAIDEPTPPPLDESIDESALGSPHEHETSNGVDAADTELTRIERILGGDAADPPQPPADGPAEAPIAPAPAAPDRPDEPSPRTTGGSPYDEPRAAFLAAPRPAPRSPRTEPSITTAPAVETALDPATDPAPAPLPANDLEPPLADPLSLDPLASDEPLLTEEEIEAFFSLDVPGAIESGEASIEPDGESIEADETSIEAAEAPAGATHAPPAPAPEPAF